MAKSVGIKDVEYAMNGEGAPPYKIENDYVPQAVITDVQPINDQFVVFKLAGTNHGGGVHIPGIDYVIDPRTITKDKPDGNGPEMIRLLNGVTQIWAKEQKDVAPEYIKRNIRNISFPRGTRFITVPSWDVSQIEFMRAARHNIKNPHRKTGSKLEYFEYDPNEIAKEQLKKEMLEIEMITKASQQKPDKMKKHAFYLGINLIDEIGRPKPEDRLRTDYILAAKRDPETFKKSLDSREVDVTYLIRAAIIDGKIDISRGDGRAYYGNGGGLICSLPKTESPLQFLTNLALTPTREGRDFKETLESLIT